MPARASKFYSTYTLMNAGALGGIDPKGPQGLLEASSYQFNRPKLYFGRVISPIKNRFLVQPLRQPSYFLKNGLVAVKQRALHLLVAVAELRYFLSEVAGSGSATRYKPGSGSGRALLFQVAANSSAYTFILAIFWKILKFSIVGRARIPPPKGPNILRILF